MKEFNFLVQYLKRRFQSVFCSGKHSKSQPLPCDFDATKGKCLVSGKEDYWSQMQDKLIDEDPLELVKLGHLFKEYCVKFSCNYNEAKYRM